jgi:hypothetical protein
MGKPVFLFSEQTKHFIALVVEMIVSAINETFLGTVHIYKLLILLHPLRLASKVLNFHAPLQVSVS